MPWSHSHLSHRGQVEKLLRCAGLVPLHCALLHAGVVRCGCCCQSCSALQCWGLRWKLPLRIPTFSCKKSHIFQGRLFIACLMLKFQAYRLFSENAHKMFDVTLISIATITMIKCLAFSLLINDKNTCLNLGSNLFWVIIFLVERDIQRVFSANLISLQKI